MHGQQNIKKLIESFVLKKSQIQSGSLSLSEPTSARKLDF